MIAAWISIPATSLVDSAHVQPSASSKTLVCCRWSTCRKACVEGPGRTSSGALQRWVSSLLACGFRVLPLILCPSEADPKSRQSLKDSV